MKFEAVSEKFGKWANYFRPFIESDKMDAIFAQLKARKGKVKTSPLAEDVFKVFLKCDPDKLRVVLVGISPYHTFTKDGSPIADGMMMSCSKTKVLQPSLTNLYEDIENTYSDTIDPDMIKDPDLTYLADQGVLLYNVALTVQAEKPCSDNLLWAEFNKFFFEEVINKYFRGIVCVFMGEQCHKSAKYLLPMVHYSFLLSHPASAAYSGTTWDSKGVWLDIDRITHQNNGMRIQWYRKRTDTPYPKEMDIDTTKYKYKETKSGKELGLPFD